MPKDPRQDQREVLKLLLGRRSTPAAIAIHGISGTGKTTILRSVLHEIQLEESTVWINARQCITSRILLQRALRALLGTHQLAESPCENAATFCALLGQAETQHQSSNLFGKQAVSNKILVLDQIDEMPDSANDLFACLPRITELAGTPVRLTTVFVYSTPDPRSLIATAIPQVHFPAYTMREALDLAADLLPISETETSLLPSCLKERGQTAVSSYWSRYLETVAQALGAYTGTDLRRIARVARELWPLFIEGASSSEFALQYQAKAAIFRSETFVEGIMPRHGDSALAALHANALSEKQKYLLCAAYLASYNHPRYDMRFFSRARDARAKRRVTRPKKSLTIPARSLAPPSFELERLLAIYRAIIPDEESYVAGVNDFSSLATLASQGSLSRDGEALDSRAKWSINVPWTYISQLAADIELPIEHYLVNE